MNKSMSRGWGEKVDAFKWMFAHRQDAQQILDGQIWLQSLFKHAHGLVFQVIVGCNAAVRQWLNGALVLKKTRRSLINTWEVKIQISNTRLKFTQPKDWTKSFILYYCYFLLPFRKITHEKYKMKCENYVLHCCAFSYFKKQPQ